MTRWSEPDANPLEDIQRALNEMATTVTINGNTCGLVMPARVFNQIQTIRMRTMLSRRSFRRWRGRQKSKRIA